MRVEDICRSNKERTRQRKCKVREEKAHKWRIHCKEEGVGGQKFFFTQTESFKEIKVIFYLVRFKVDLTCVSEDLLYDSSD